MQKSVAVATTNATEEVVAVDAGNLARFRRWLSNEIARKVAESHCATGDDNSVSHSSTLPPMKIYHRLMHHGATEFRTGPAVSRPAPASISAFHGLNAKHLPGNVLGEWSAPEDSSPLIDSSPIPGTKKFLVFWSRRSRAVIWNLLGLEVNFSSWNYDWQCDVCDMIQLSRFREIQF